MKIGILTLPLHTNYGGILQAFALQTVLVRMGHEVLLIDQQRNNPSLSNYKKPAVYLKRIFKKYILGKNIHIFLEKYNINNQDILEKETALFINRYFKKIAITNLDAIKENEFDVIVVGSDQIWRPLYFSDSKKENAFLYFTKSWKSIKRIAYAPSFGIDEWEYDLNQTKMAKEIIKQFDLVTVREDSAIDLCSKFLDIDATQVLDPTMLLTKEDYILLLKGFRNSLSGGDLLAYMLDSSSSSELLISEVAEHKSMKPFYVSSKIEDPEAPIEERIQKPVEDWLCGFKNAKFVITDSFHACVFSILFNIPFAVIGNKKRGMTRFTSLLKLFMLEDRLVENSSDIIMLGDIKWDLVNRQLAVMRDYSIYLLKSSISK